MKRCPDKDEDPTCGWCGDRGHGQGVCTSTVPRCAACKEEHCTQSVNCMDRNRRLHLRACAKFGPPAWPSHANSLRPHGRREGQSRNVDSGSSGSAGVSQPAATSGSPSSRGKRKRVQQPDSSTVSGAVSSPRAKVVVGSVLSHWSAQMQTRNPCHPPAILALHCGIPPLWIVNLRAEA